MHETLTGKNIILRHALPTDYESMLKNIWSDPDVYLMMLFEPTFTIDDAIRRNERTMEFHKSHYMYYVALKDTNEAIGFAGIKENFKGHYEESGICIGTKYQGKGYGKEVVSLLLDLAFNRLDAEDFEYGYFKDNLKSKKLAEHFHFHYVKTITMVRPWDKKEEIIDTCILTKEEYIHHNSI